ncbi:CROCC protein, partial [Corythaixoides concolor]|nr:CROCC protein [Corythaixoides concolor]
LGGLQRTLAQAAAELEQQRQEVTGHQEKEQSLAAELRTLWMQAEKMVAAHEQEAKTLHEQAMVATKQWDRALRRAEEARAQLRVVAEAWVAGWRDLLEPPREAWEKREGQEMQWQQ